MGQSPAFYETWVNDLVRAHWRGADGLPQPSLAGEAATLDTGAFGNETNRQPLAQSFRLLNNDQVLTLV